jgi:hypothetical protein
MFPFGTPFLLCSASCITWHDLFIMHCLLQVTVPPPLSSWNTVCRRPKNCKSSGSYLGCTCAQSCGCKAFFVLYCCRYVLHRHDEAALLSLVWQGALICRTVRQMRWTACVSMIFALLKPFFSFIFALLFSLRRRCPVVAWRWFVAASTGFSLRCRSHGRRSR